MSFWRINHHDMEADLRIVELLIETCHALQGSADSQLVAAAARRERLLVAEFHELQAPAIPMAAEPSTLEDNS